MLEVLVNPKKAERKPWTMFFIGLIYASLSVLLVSWIFSGDSVLSKYLGLLVVTFSVMFTLPFMYYLIKYEEEKDVELEEKIGYFGLLKEHSNALKAFLWLFLGFIVAFAFWYLVLGNGPSFFQAQIETYCAINRPSNFEQCVNQYGAGGMKTTGFSFAKERLFSIFANNIYVLIFTLVFSLIFGAGAIFVLAWNASVIAAAMGIHSRFYNSALSSLPLSLARYMIHGIPEIGAYFVGALAGGIVSIAIIRHNIHDEKFWDVLQDSLNLIIVAVLLLFIAALIEVFITPVLF